MTDDTLSPAHRKLLNTVPLRAASRIITSTVSYEHDGDPMEGYLAVDEAHEGRRPGVLILHDWGGIAEYTHVRAQMLARLGYIAFAADIYGAGIRPDGDDAPNEAGKYYSNPELLRARVEAGYRELQANVAVDPDRIVVVGYCFGGTAALEFARTGADVRGVVSFHGGLVAHDPSDADAIRASLLILTGGSDPVVPDEAIIAFENELRAAAGVDWEVITYSGAPHAFTLPETDHYRPLADTRSWRRFVDFLEEVAAERRSADLDPGE
jgi:dienelactone hydrolase